MGFVLALELAGGVDGIAVALVIGGVDCVGSGVGVGAGGVADFEVRLGAVLVGAPSEVLMLYFVLALKLALDLVLA